MASITDGDRKYLEEVLNMRSGYVLDYTDATFGQLFNRYGVDIHNYTTYGDSKAKKMRAFLEKDDDLVVGQVLTEMLGVYKALCDSGSCRMNSAPYQTCRKIVGRLGGKLHDGDSPVCEFSMPNSKELPVDSATYGIIRIRLEEAERCMSVDAHLSAIIMCGSVLEAVLYGAAAKDPKRFGCSRRSPKGKDNKVKPFKEWRLVDLIDVARDIGLLKMDAQGFSHVLRDFRNYIHPAKQAETNFEPSKQTAKLCISALGIALANVAEDFGSQDTDSASDKSGGIKFKKFSDWA